MPEYIRAYIVVFALSNFVFWLLPKLRIGFTSNFEIKTWRNYWLLITTLCFFASNIWIYVVGIILILVYANRSKIEPLPLFFAISCASPLFYFTIPGFGVVNYVISLSYMTLLVLVLLLPQNNNLTFQRISKYPYLRAIIAYVVIIALLDSRGTTLTHALRTIAIALITILAPLILLCRSLNNTETFKKCLFALALCLTPLALLGCFESIKYWKLYSSSFVNLLGEKSSLDYGLRGNSLRASTLFAGPIVFGYMMVVGIGVLLFVQKYINRKHLFRFIFILFVSALYFTKARGPWLGMVILVILYIWSGPNRFGNFSKFTAGSVVALIVLSLTSFGERLIAMLPFMSSADSHETSTIDYRIRLLDQAKILFQKNSTLGSPNYIETPEMEVMRQGQGIIDVVNSYIDIALSYGIVGLGLFVFIFFGLFFTVLKKLRALPPEQEDLVNIGRSLYAIMGAILFIIFTVSSINYIPIFYWLFAGLCSAYIKLCNGVITESKNQAIPQPHQTQATSPLPSPP